ncbi:PROTEIN PHYTOCHROME KINASE SUBSTRATE 3 [Salix viminalis]|uniref:PROTEIN PHYTOCHROME KINASE SUBSTRATE 3 n=1 Tax=Salix viminalis TaxID=40686 RepID=A0A9Q0NVT2_SALVM|nr:PROTEIN PHYTOCHROME KINASE SUBSTRATE 3 [Salix viminalis]
MKLDDDSPRITDNINAGKCVREKEYPVDLQQMRPKSRLGTPSVTSEASWNSQAALIPNSLRNSSPTRHQKVNERWFLSGFPCSGSCSDKKSVDTDKDTCRRGVHGKELRKESALNPIGLEGARKAVPITIKPGGEKKIIEDDPRKSLEVFGSHLLKREDIALNLERKLSVLTWDAIPKAPNFPTTSTSSQMYEDIESDGSSDLFEIENLSGCSHVQPVFTTKQTPDAMSSCMTPTSRCYEPSESSIEWSVVTASAADFSAVSVDYDEKILAGNSKINPGLASTAPRKSRPNGLLGCKNQKAVDVAEAAYKRNDKAKSHHLQQLRRTDAAVPPRKLQANENIYGETS